MPTRYGSWPIIVDEDSNSEEVGFAGGLRLMPSKSSNPKDVNQPLILWLRRRGYDR
jgi:hypothetical protein